MPVIPTADMDLLTYTTNCRGSLLQLLVKRISGVRDIDMDPQIQRGTLDDIQELKVAVNLSKVCPREVTLLHVHLALLKLVESTRLSHLGVFAFPLDPWGSGGRSHRRLRRRARANGGQHEWRQKEKKSKLHKLFFPALMLDHLPAHPPYRHFVMMACVRLANNPTEQQVVMRAIRAYNRGSIDQTAFVCFINTFFSPSQHQKLADIVREKVKRLYMDVEERAWTQQCHRVLSTV